MKQEYLKFTLEELIEDREFIVWVLRGKNSKEWENFLFENPGFKVTVKKARKIIELLRDHHEAINEDDILKIWKNIETFDFQFQNRSRKIKRNRFLRYAAILVFALLIGGSAGYWMIVQNQKSYVFFASSPSRYDNQSHLFLSDGRTVDLEKENSIISLNDNQQIFIDNNEVIDLSKTTSTDDTKMNEVVIPFGKKSQLILEDGTKVWLNAGSRMAFPTKFSEKNREVFLEGEAYFEVAHNKNIPFLVNTKDISIKVLGTRFNISAYISDELTETTLIEGKVAISERSSLSFLKKEIFLAPNQKASYNKDHKTITVKNEPDADLSIAWTEGWFKFSQENLNDVLNKLQRYYNVQFVFERGFSTTDLITGKLDLKDSIEKVMYALADVAKIQYRIDGEKIFIEKKITELKMR